MSHARFSSRIAALFAAALMVATIPLPGAQAADAAGPVAQQDAAAVAALLVRGPWRFTGQGWVATRTFNKDGTFTTLNMDNAGGTWQISAGAVILTFQDGHKDSLSLPLDAKGTAGADAFGKPTLAMMTGDASAPEAPPRAGTAQPPAAANSPAPAAATPIAALPADPRALLIHGPWQISKGGRSDVRVFHRDGTYTTPDKADDHGQWAMAEDAVIITLPSGHKDGLALPLDARGTSGYADNGDAITAIMLNASAANGTLDPADAPAPHPGDASVHPGDASAHPASPPMTQREVAAAASVLTAAPWKMTAARWFAVRTFNKDGTFATTGNGKEHGAWKIADQTVSLIFLDGHIDTLALPLDPKGTEGTGKDGAHFTALQESAAESPPVPGTMEAILHPEPTPVVMNDQEKAKISADLIAASWKITGAGWFAIRIFAVDGTFTTAGRPKEFGNWSITGNAILLTYQDGHKDTIGLPLDPKGTDGADRKGAPTIAVQQPPDPGGGLPTPAPTAAPVDDETAAAGAPKPLRKKATPPPFGTGTEEPEDPLAPHATPLPFGTKDAN